MQNQAYILTLVKKLMMKILNSKLLILIEYQNIKTFLQKAMFQNPLKKFLWLKKFKTMWRGDMLLPILKEKNFLGRLIKKNWKDQIEKSLELKSN